MPNWCDNLLSVHGNAASLARLEKRVKGVDKESGADTAFSLEKVLPTPKEIVNLISPPRPGDRPSAELIKRFGHADWYDWRIANWGTKWDVEAEIVERSTSLISYRFDSAWSPPISAIEKLSRRYPSLKFELIFDEPGMDLAGRLVLQNGVTQESQRYPSPAGAAENEANEAEELEGQVHQALQEHRSALPEILDGLGKS